MKYSCIIICLMLFVFGFTHRHELSKPDGPVVPGGKQVVLGVENFLQNYLDSVKGKRVGIVTNPSGVNRSLKSTADLLFEHPDVNLTALYGPEHGIRGAIHAGEKVDSEQDEQTGLPIFSLYGKTMKPTKDMLEDVDVLIVDIQDIGARSYTYIYTMAMVMEAAAEFDKEVIIFDRPNPMGGDAVEGNIVQPDYYSFVGLYPLAYRHGMTIGELARMFNSEFKINCNLTVIPMLYWSRDQYWCDTGLPWVPTSPHIPHWETVLYYVATGTFGELHTLSEGVGYTSPFELAGAPWINGAEFARALTQLNLPGVIFRPLYFKPYYLRDAGKVCQGVQLHITDYRSFRPFITGIHIMKTAMDLYPDQDIFEKAGRLRMFNQVMGSNRIMNSLKSGKSVIEIESEWQDELADFKRKREKYLIY